MAKCINVKYDGKPLYDIVIEKSFSRLSDEFNRLGVTGRKLCIVSDSNVARLYADDVAKELEKTGNKVFTYVFKAGEENKNLNTVEDVYEFLIQNHFDRKDMLVALGGGVVGDLTGFTAATYLRGIDFIQIPTSLLAQVDSSIGGKTGVDFRAYKNMVGAFHQPRLVYMNMNTLKSLPPVEFACGMGEVLKTGLICDADFYEYVLANHEAIRALDTAALAKMIRRCCEIKAGVVERDPKEQGERALLNLGHTVGHAVEKLKDFQLLHGQCVAIGLVAAAYISWKRELLTEEEYNRIREGCLLYDLPVSAEGLDEAAVLAVTKRQEDGTGTDQICADEGIGNSFIDRSVSDEELLEGIREILK